MFDGDEGQIVGSFEIYRAEGESLFKNGAYAKAIQSFSTVNRSTFFTTF